MIVMRDGVGERDRNQVMGGGAEDVRRMLDSLIRGLDLPLGNRNY